jgi:DNA-binding GntR family transcriptional regulator
VREALRELEMLGFVRSEPHRGTYVRDPWQRGMLELYELRGALEEFAARMATPRLSDDVEPLQAEVDAMAAAAVADDVHAPSSTASASIA